MNEKKGNPLPPPKFRQANSDDVISIPDIIAMDVKYIVMQVDKYKEATLLDKIEGEIYIKNNVNDKVNSIPYYITPDKINDDCYFILFHVSDMNFFGLCEAKYKVTDLNKNVLYSMTSNINILGNDDMADSDYELIFPDAKKSILSLHEINANKGVLVRAKFKSLAIFDTIVITAKTLDINHAELDTLEPTKITLDKEQVNSNYVDYTLKTDKLNLAEAKYFIAKFSVLDKSITSDYSQASIFDDLDNVNVKVQTTKNIGVKLDDDQNVKPFLTAVIYTDLNNSRFINAHLTNAHFSDDSSSTQLSNIDENGVSYLNIYSDDITKNSVLTINYLDPVIAYKVPLDFSNWMMSSNGELSYTYSSYGVADGVCQCFLLIKPLLSKITDITVVFDSNDIMINGSKSNILKTSIADSNKILTCSLTSSVAVRAGFTINVGGVSMAQINNTIVFVDPLTL
ncbi:conserved protein of unknown function [Xenorhabdus poinarii G6]|uniref:Uncharacterized protein n=1 Tax=Xenorhabdus poinarii G6 TaxID=1354304 RepID=A0A068R6Z6_9GAMM|nr:hypothetical protein [Xenorhabdus poinarii]CDG22993.1 conserved protein of unknown function [Xenorhabdus poinarii G6]